MRHARLFFATIEPVLEMGPNASAKSQYRNNVQGNRGEAGVFKTVRDYVQRVLSCQGASPVRLCKTRRSCGSRYDLRWLNLKLESKTGNRLPASEKGQPDFDSIG
jgi:hypothetical protein